MANAQRDTEHQEELRTTGFWGKRGAGCFVMCQSTGRVLMPLRSPSVEQPNTWGVWGGAVDGTEAPAKSAKRELCEETGYKGVLKLIPLFVFKKSEFEYHNFLALVPEEFEPRLDWETKSFKWCNLSKLPTPLHFGVKALLADERSVKVIQSVVDAAGKKEHASLSSVPDMRLIRPSSLIRMKRLALAEVALSNRWQKLSPCECAIYELSGIGQDIYSGIAHPRQPSGEIHTRNGSAAASLAEVVRLRKLGLDREAIQVHPDYQRAKSKSDRLSGWWANQRREFIDGNHAKASKLLEKQNFGSGRGETVADAIERLIESGHRAVITAGGKLALVGSDMSGYTVKQLGSVGMAYAQQLIKALGPETASTKEDDYIDSIMSPHANKLAKIAPAQPAPARPAITGWFNTLSPLQKHAYLTAHPNSKFAGQGPATAPPIKSRADFHRASLAFHEGRAQHFKPGRKEFGDRADNLYSAHNRASVAHQKALSSLLDKQPDYTRLLDEARVATDAVEAAHKNNSEPAGVGKSRYVVKE